jgi:predicted dehydrogenase
VSDIVAEKAERLAKELGCRAFSSHRDLIPLIDAVSVATPTTTHEDIAVDLLSAGIPVLVEKPLAHDAGSGKRIVEAARAAARTLAVGQIERCNPAFLAARKDLSAPRFIESHRLATFVPRSIDVDVVLDLMIHDIDLVLALARSPLESIDAVGVPVITSAADIANARLRFADGSVANLTASRVSSQKMRKIRFFERNLYLSIDLAARRLERVRLIPMSGDAPEVRAGGSPSADPPTEATPEALFLAERGLHLERSIEAEIVGDALASEIGAFLDSCAGKGAPAVTGEEGLRSLEVALDVREAVLRTLPRLTGQPTR